jgi:two-component system, NtrC family, response regulator AtoC
MVALRMMQPTRILVADDEQNLRRVLAALLRRDNYEVVQASDGAEAITMMSQNIDVVITDLRMPQATGMDVLQHAAKHQPHIPVIMITAYGSVGQAVEAIKSGAFDYIEKPFEQDVIRATVRKAVGQALANRVAPRTEIYSMSGPQTRGRYGLIGTSAEMQSVFSIIERVADTPSTVLITGESGTGKELVAKALHEHSSRKDGPFIKINCAAIPKNLMESELFGYEKGAFTGAVNSKPGRFELADNGTLFLDEIGEIPVEMQVKLLRAIQESEFERVGGLKTIKVNVRLITATNRDLEQEISRGNFREDLYYRLNVVPLQIPPLRKRQGDIRILVTHILTRFNERLKKNVEGLTDEAIAALEAHPWPGNIRELENILERTILFCRSQRIELDELPDELTGADGTVEAAAVETSDKTEGPAEFSGETSLKDIVKAETIRVERELIVRALDETTGNVTQAARLLKISRKSLQMKMKEFGLREKEVNAASS